MAKPSIMCLEGDWSSDLADRLSVESHLRLLVDLGVFRSVIHRDVATKEELNYYMRRWLRKSGSTYPILYLAFHGDRGRIWLRPDLPISMPEIGEAIGLDGAPDRILYFGSCLTLQGDGHDAVALCKSTGLRGVLGYANAVDWVDSAAFDLLLLAELARSTNLGSMRKRLDRRNPHLSSALGFRLITARGVSGST